jgi:hypothetical protein
LTGGWSTSILVRRAAVEEGRHRPLGRHGELEETTAPRLPVAVPIDLPGQPRVDIRSGSYDVGTAGTTIDIGADLGQP